LVRLRERTGIERIPHAGGALEELAVCEVAQALLQEFDLPFPSGGLVAGLEVDHQVAQALRLPQDALLVASQTCLYGTRVVGLLGRQHRADRESAEQRSDGYMQESSHRFSGSRLSVPCC